MAKHQKRLTVIVLFFLLLPCAFDSKAAGDDQTTALQKGWNLIKRDYEHFYSADRLLSLGVAYGVGGIMANSAVDENIQDWYQDHLRNSGTDHLSKTCKMFGEGVYLIPFSLITAGVGAVIPDESQFSPIGTWGQRVARGLFGRRPRQSRNAENYRRLQPRRIKRQLSLAPL